jgi:hypothetical protein
MMPKLGQLFLSYNDFGDEAVDKLTRIDLKNLTSLYIGHTYVSDAGLRLIINTFPRLKSLSVTGINISSAVLQGCQPQFFSNI